MADPYNSSALESFRAARKFATTDPKLLRLKKIFPDLADKWRQVIPFKPLSVSARLLADHFGYGLIPELPNEFVWLSRSNKHEKLAVMVHDFTGTLWGFAALAQALNAPCIGIQCSMRVTLRGDKRV